jgi:large subunit ribosomal protein L15
VRLADIKPQVGARQVSKKRVGRGHGSGMGKTSGRGMRGQNCRSGGGVRPGFEGGQTPLYRRLPKLSYFTNPNTIVKTEFTVGRLDALELAPGSTVTHEMLSTAGFVTKHGSLRILGNGEITMALHITATHFTESARTKIEAAGGTCTEGRFH